MAGKYDFLNFMDEQELADQADDDAALKDLRERKRWLEERITIREMRRSKRVNRAIARARLDEKRTEPPRAYRKKEEGALQ